MNSGIRLALTPENDPDREKEVCDMVLYRENSSPSIGKWIVAILIFVLVMTVTWDDVEGISFGAKKTETTDAQQTPAEEQTESGDTQQSPDQPPADIPEPATVLLLGTGLGVAYLAKRKKNC